MKRNCFIFFLSVFIFFLITEIALEYFDYQREKERAKQCSPYYRWSTHTGDGKIISRMRGYLKLGLYPLVGYRNLPNQATPYFYINNQGFRAKKNYLDKADKKRIIIVGGSAAFGTGLCKDEDTLAAQLEKLLPDTEVINAAVIGYQSGQELVYLLTDLIDLKPDLIIAFDGANDAYQIVELKKVNAIGVSGFRKLETQLEQLYTLTESNFIVRLGHLYKVVFPRFSELTSKAISKIKRLTNKKMVESRLAGYDEKDLIAASYAYAKNILKMSMVAKASNCKFICFLQPQKFSSDTQGFNNPDKIAYGIFRKEVRNYFQENKTLYIDLNEYGERIPAEVYIDNTHLDAKGNLILAKIIAAIIRERELLDLTGQDRKFNKERI